MATLFRRRFTLLGLVALVPALLSGTLSPRHDPQVCLSSAPPARAVYARHAPGALRIVTYNLHSGLGSRWRLYAARGEVEANLRGIAKSIAGASQPAVDLIGLNEVDFAARRTGWFDQAEFLARELKMLTGYTYTVLRGETWRRDLFGTEVRFGNAALVRHPILAWGSCLLEGACVVPESGRPVTSAKAPGRILGKEPRGVLRARISFGGQPLELLVTHLEAFNATRREAQAAQIRDQFVHNGQTTVLVGDMNATRSAPAHGLLTEGPLVDARSVLSPEDESWPTYPSPDPKWALDSIFASADLVPVAIRAIGGAFSDHCGLVVDYRWSGEGAHIPDDSARGL